MSRPGFTLEQMRSFVAVADREHISKAAASLFLTQGAVTQQIRHFEKAVGLQLLERDGRRVRLTDAGRTLAESCRAALRSVAVVDDSARALKDLQAGSIHVGGSPTCASYYLPVHLAEFTRRYPAVRLDVDVAPTAELNRRVVSGSLDCALIEGEPDPVLQSRVVSPDELLLVVQRDHPLAQLERVTPADLSRYRYMRRGPEFSAEAHVRTVLGDVYDRIEALNLGHPEYVRAATIAGLGFAALSKRAVAADLSSGILKQLPFPPIMRAITAVRREAKGGPAQEAFWDLITGSALASSAKIAVNGDRS
ncbi:MAG TPA: LysR family transcriptional regulator [Candidatus Dormibacteraeota bacterium]|nr:LysR family transcriptional regulator [Candidatus Dormibacteraeota bacterium]